VISLKPKRGQDMSKKQKEQKEQTKTAQDSTFKTSVKSSVIGGVIVAAIVALPGFFNGIMALPKRVDGIETRLDKIDNSLEKISDNLGGIDDRIDGLESRVSKLESNITAIEKAMEFIMDNSSVYIGEGSSIIQNGIKAASLSLSDNDIIAVAASGKKYTAEELKNQRIITSYEQDGQLIVFCGQYNDSYHWEGNCILNAYKNNILTYAEAATYDDGRRTFNEQLMVDDDNKSIIYARRIQDDNVNSGDTWKYRKEKNIEKIINLDQPRERDLIVPDFYLSNLGDYFCHYHGDTSEGKYNDTTGEAYLLSYDEEGYIKTLYCGKFKDGQFEDTTGEAWYITRNKDTEYMYFKGAFKEGHPEGSGESENPVTMKTIENMTSDQPFSEELKWDMDHIK